jgi:hypothetical protein
MDRKAPAGGLRFLLAFAGWATLLFLPAWWLSHAWQQALAALASSLVALRGSQVEIVDIELFYPMDLAVFVALCLASGWASWSRRLRAMLVGAPLMVLAELAALTLALATVVGASGAGSTVPRQEEAARLADALIRVTGLAVAAAVWFLVLGRERFAMRSSGARSRS